MWLGSSLYRHTRHIFKAAVGVAPQHQQRQRPMRVNSCGSRQVFQRCPVSQRTMRLALMGFFQQRYVKRHAIYHKPDIHNEIPSLRCYQNQTALRPPIFWGLIRTESSSFPPEKSCSPSRLNMPPGPTGQFARATNSISYSFAARGAVQSCSGAEDAIDNWLVGTPQCRRSSYADANVTSRP
jgi:hypothetical protein